MVAVLAALALVLLGAQPAEAQLFTTTTTSTTTPEETSTTTTTLLLGTSTTSTSLAESTTTSSTTDTTAPPAPTTAPPRSTTTVPPTTEPTFVPPGGVEPAPAEEEIQEELASRTGLLPWFVALSLLGFAVAVAILLVQWLRSARPPGRRRS